MLEQRLNLEQMLSVRLMLVRMVCLTTNKMDEENNTSEVIDNQIGVIDTYVEPIKVWV
jgi:hypothetical protein